METNQKCFLYDPTILSDAMNKISYKLKDVGQMDKKHFESMFWKILYAICLRLICNIIEIFNHMKSSKSYYITVIEDVNSSLIVGTATLFTENKFIHGGSLRGRIEDVVVDAEYRGQKLGEILIQTKKFLAEILQCYKLTLDCRDEMIPWYQKFGFAVEDGRSNFMTIRFVH
ncbi:glucosamine 6-phosphate N-acetyltransferase-like protein [Sarcoptes scabiei]|uniref:Glucosamine 6-phosphate N-acetyltransferase n=1 Tax=Sarcoptes scabiei TaxID=52283 RepID=A0A132AHW4_SARSC|nr:glucosamine 6-phosphate N-acetyltransferase-like protein [Sarcoptes scabiei]